MTQEQLEIGKQLEKQIDQLIDHRDTIEKRKNKNLYVYNDHGELRQEFLILPTEEIIELYLRKVDNKINKLQKQLDEL